MKKAFIAAMAFSIFAGMQPTIAAASDDEIRMDSSIEEFSEELEDDGKVFEPFSVGDIVTFTIDDGYVIDGGGAPIHVSKGERFYVTSCTGKPNLMVCFVPKSNMNLYIYTDTEGLEVQKGKGVIVGDLTGDFKVDTFDLCELEYRIINQIAGEYGELGLHVADYNGDGEVNISDAVRLQKFVLQG